METSGIDDLKYGDLIWAIRTNPFKKYLKERPGHDQGPYIYLYHDDNGIYVICGTGYNNHAKRKQNYVFDQESISTLGKIVFKKRGMFILRYINCIPKENFRFKIISLDERNLQNFTKSLRIANPEGLDKVPFLQETQNLYLNEGDIFEYSGSVYIAISKDDDCIFALRVTVNEDGSYNYHINDLDIFEATLTDYILEGYIGDTNIKKLKECCSLNKSKDIPKDFNVKPGTIIISDFKVYYVSAIDGDYYLCYPLEITDFHNCDINFNHMYFKIDFVQEKVPRSKYCDVCCVFGQPEMRTIQDMKTARKKVEKNPEKEDEIKKKYCVNINRQIRYERLNALSPEEASLKLFGKAIHPYRKPNEVMFAYELRREDNEWLVTCVTLEDLIKGEFTFKEYNISQLTVSDISMQAILNSIPDLVIDYSNPVYNSLFLNHGVFRLVNYNFTEDNSVFVKKKFNLVSKKTLNDSN